MLLRIKIYLAKRVGGVCLKQCRMRLQKPLQLLVGGLDATGDVVRNELQLLPQPLAHDGIVTIQTRGDRFTIRGLLTNVFANQSPQLLVGGRPLPRSREADDEGFNCSSSDDDFARFVVIPLRNE